MSRSPRNASARRLRRVAARMAWHRVDWRQRLGGTGSHANGRRRGATRRYVATRSTGGHADCVGRSRSALGIDRRRREVASRIGERPLGTATSKNPSHDGIGPDSRAFASHGHGPDTVRPPICFFTPDSPNYAVAGTLTRVSFMPGLSCTPWQGQFNPPSGVWRASSRGSIREINPGTCPGRPGDAAEQVCEP